MPTTAEAESFIASSTFAWHQRFELVPDVFTPGPGDVGWLLNRSRLPADFSGLTVLDIGTTNGGGAFLLEARGAARVVAVDVMDADFHGITQIRDFLGSRVEFVQCSVYELSSVLEERFDVVLCWGVLYHLRHPLLALDELRAVTGQTLSLETAIADADLPDGLRRRPLVSFLRGDDLAEDPSNWFVPTSCALSDWITSSGFEIEWIDTWTTPDPTRALITASVALGMPEYQRVSYELPLTAQVAVDLPGSWHGAI